MPPKAKAGPADMLAQATKARDGVKRDLEKQNDRLAKAAEKATAAEKARAACERERDEVNAELTKAQRLVDALAALVPDAPNPQTVEPDGIESGEAVMESDQATQPVA